MPWQPPLVVGVSSLNHDLIWRTVQRLEPVLIYLEWRRLIRATASIVLAVRAFLLVPVVLATEHRVQNLDGHVTRVHAALVSD